MRRLVAASVVLLTALVATAGCTPKSSAEPSWKSPVAKPADTGPGSSVTVCHTIRTVVTTDMGPLGTAFGAIVGRATANDSEDLKEAEARAVTALKKLGSDISSASAVADDTILRAAGKTVDTSIQALAADPSYLSGITTMTTMAAATTQLQQATVPVSTACAGS